MLRMSMAALPTTSHENRTTNMEDIAFVLRRFGDEQSTLLDQFERLSFEVHLNQAILRRSFSEPVAVSKSQAPPPMPVVMKPRKKRLGRRAGSSSSSSSGFTKILKKLLKPFFVTKGSSININNNGARNHQVPDPKNPNFFKTFSRSLRH